MNKVNNKKNYQIPSKCKHFIRRTCKCEDRIADMISVGIVYSPFELCNPKVSTCKYFE